MKKTNLNRLAIGIIALACSFGSKADRLVLFEEFTNSGCAPCARFSPGADSLLIVRLGEVVAIKYHANYPDPRDPFYLNEKENLDIRQSFYNITGVPSVILDGTQISASLPAISNKIDELKTGEQKLSLKIENSIADGNLAVKVSVRPLNSYDNENLRLFVTVIEEEIIFDEPTSNGETEFRGVLKKFLPDANGYDLGKLTDTTQDYTYETTWPITGFYNEDQLAIVAFVQDIATKEVYETIYAPKQTDQTEAAKIILVQDTPNKICTPYYSAKVLFRNTGSNNMTTANICVDINGSVQKTPWTGNLAYLESATIVTPVFTDFSLNEDGQTNDVRIYVSEINGTTAESAKSELTFNNSVEAQESVQLTLFTDNKPEETTWKLYNSIGDIVDEGGPYTEKRYFIKTFLNTKDDDCYMLEFLDSGGDGIKGNFGNGYYKLDQYLSDGKHSMIVQGDYDGEKHQVFFKLKNSSAVTNVLQNNWCRYLPADKSLELKLAEGGYLTITDLAGRTVYSRFVENNENISLKELHGIYIVNLTSGKNNYTQKIIIE